MDHRGLGQRRRQPGRRQIPTEISGASRLASDFPITTTRADLASAIAVFAQSLSVAFPGHGRVRARCALLSARTV
jgi:hypothetical protein